MFACLCGDSFHFCWCFTSNPASVKILACAPSLLLSRRVNSIRDIEVKNVSRFFCRKYGFRHVAAMLAALRIVRCGAEIKMRCVPFKRCPLVGWQLSSVVYGGFRFFSNFRLCLSRDRTASCLSLTFSSFFFLSSPQE